MANEDERERKNQKGTFDRNEEKTLFIIIICHPWTKSSSY